MAFCVTARGSLPLVVVHPLQPTLLISALATSLPASYPAVACLTLPSSAFTCFLLPLSAFTCPLLPSPALSCLHVQVISVYPGKDYADLHYLVGASMVVLFKPMIGLSCAHEEHVEESRMKMPCSSIFIASFPLTPACHYLVPSARHGTISLPSHLYDSLSSPSLPPSFTPSPSFLPSPPLPPFLPARWALSPSAMALAKTCRCASPAPLRATAASSPTPTAGTS